MELPQRGAECTEKDSFDGDYFLGVQARAEKEDRILTALRLNGRPGPTAALWLVKAARSTPAERVSTSSQSLAKPPPALVAHGAPTRQNLHLWSPPPPRSAGRNAKPAYPWPVPNPRPGHAQPDALAPRATLQAPSGAACQSRNAQSSASHHRVVYLLRRKLQASANILRF